MTFYDHSDEFVSKHRLIMKKYIDFLKTSVLYCSLLLLSAGCKKDKSEPPAPAPLTPEQGIYIAGEKYWGANPWEVHAVSIANEETNELTPSGIEAYAKAITHLDKDIYVAGHEAVGEENEFARKRNVATVWKNGVAQRLTDGKRAAKVHDIVVSGKSVYVSGEESETATGVLNFKVCYWKDGVQHKLTTPPNGQADGVMTVQGQDVYIAGNIMNVQYTPVYKQLWQPIYWKNNTITELDKKDFDYAAAFGIATSGANIYVAGTGYRINAVTNTTTSVPVLWTNGVLRELTTANGTNIQATGIAVSANDVYVIGKKGAIEPCYWKNGTLIALEVPQTPAYHAQAQRMYIVDNDVYVCGYIDFKPVYWKNNKLVRLKDDWPTKLNDILVIH